MIRAWKTRRGSRWLPGLTVCLLTLGGPLPTLARQLTVPTHTGSTLGGLPLRDGDLGFTDLGTGASRHAFNENAFSANENVDGVHAFSLGLLLSTTTDATLGGLTFEDGDVVPLRPEHGDRDALLRRGRLRRQRERGRDRGAGAGTAGLVALGLVALAWSGRRRS
jgi:hypothetical protein